jgi:glycosyltransferase involved in cell wall biosynthesis
MAKAIANAMSDDDRRAALAKLGSRRAEDFRWDETARRTLEVYRAALGLPAADAGRESPAGDAGTSAGDRG